MKSTIYWLGEGILFKEGETALVALEKAGITSYGNSKNGQVRGVFCGIGQCQNCLIKEESIGIVEACLLICRNNMHLSPVRNNKDS